MSRARLAWLTVWFLFVAVSGCSKNDDSTTTSEASKAASAQATVSPSPASMSLSRLTPAPRNTAASTATDADDAGDSGDTPVSVSADADTDSGGAPLTVTFTAEVEGGPLGLRYRWEFGDDTPPARQLRVEHTYQQPGDYTATFWVTGPPDSGIEESREVSIEVTEEGFDFDIETDSDVGTAPLNVEFNARLDEDVDEDEDSPGPFYFQWEFGDGARDVSNPTTHTYRSPGEYTATVTVTNARGQRATRDVEITVDAPDDTTPADQ